MIKLVHLLHSSYIKSIIYAMYALEINYGSYLNVKHTYVDTELLIDIV